MEKKKLKLYLDNCCYNRPYDDQSQISIALETQAKLYIQSRIREGYFLLVTSFVLDFENMKNPHFDRRCGISDFFRYSREYIDAGKRMLVEEIAQRIISTGVKLMDACHIACAEMAKCDYFLTTDKRLLKYSDSKIKLINPIDFLSAIKGDENGN